MILLKWFPPSWLQVKTGNKVLYVDPSYLKTYYAKHPKRIEFSTWPDPIDGLPEELEKGDLILITHDHKDHVKDVTVNRLRRPDTLIVGPPRCKEIFGECITVIRPGEEISFKGIRIQAVDAYNTKEGHSTRKIHHKGHGAGYIIRIKGKTIYHAGDTDLIPEMKELGAVDVALLPIGGTYTMDIQEAVKATVIIRPKAVIPMHHLKADPRQFQERLKRVSVVKAVLLSIGEVYGLSESE